MGRTANPNLTVDELDALFHLSQGMTALEIAEFHGLGKRQVEWRIEQMKSKLGAKTLSHAVWIAFQKGILTVPKEDDGQS